MSHQGKMQDLKWRDPLNEVVVGREILLDEDGRPTKMPVFPDGTFLFAAIEQGLGENVFLCESTDDIQAIMNAGPGANSLRWFSGHMPESLQAASWKSLTGKFSEIEIHKIELYNPVALKRMMLLHVPIEAMRALAELLLHDDPRLDELLMDLEVTAHWKDWAFGGNGYEPTDCEYVVELDRRRTQLTDRQVQQ